MNILELHWKWPLFPTAPAISVEIFPCNTGGGLFAGHLCHSKAQQHICHRDHGTGVSSRHRQASGHTQMDRKATAMKQELFMAGTVIIFQSKLELGGPSFCPSLFL